MSDIKNNIFHGYGKKIKQLRFFAGYTTQKEFTDKHDFSLNTLQSLENERIALSDNLASKLHNIFNSEGIKFDIDWLKSDSSDSQLNLGFENLNIEDKDQISKEIKFFASIHRKPIVILNMDDAMLPFFEKGDYLGGVKIDIDNLVNNPGIYIVKAEFEDRYIVRKVEHIVNDLFNVEVTNVNTKILPTFRKKIKILDVYKIIWIRKKQ